MTIEAMEITEVTLRNILAKTREEIYERCKAEGRMDNGEPLANEEERNKYQLAQMMYAKNWERLQQMKAEANKPTEAEAEEIQRKYWTNRVKRLRKKKEEIEKELAEAEKEIKKFEKRG